MNFIDLLNVLTILRDYVNDYITLEYEIYIIKMLRMPILQLR